MDILHPRAASTSSRAVGAAAQGDHGTAANADKVLAERLLSLLERSPYSSGQTSVPPYKELRKLAATTTARFPLVISDPALHNLAPTIGKLATSVNQAICAQGSVSGEHATLLAIDAAERVASTLRAR